MVIVATIVEGPSEVESIRTLLNKICCYLGIEYCNILRPFRVKKDYIRKTGNLENAIEHLLRDRQGANCILILLDADDDCPVDLSRDLLQRCHRCTDKPCRVIIANKEFEAWFLGAITSLRGIRGIRNNAQIPDNPENIRGAKEYLSRLMINRRYIEIDDQPALVAAMDIDLAYRNCRSFRKLCEDLRWLNHELADNKM